MHRYKLCLLCLCASVFTYVNTVCMRYVCAYVYVWEYVYNVFFRVYDLYARFRLSLHVLLSNYAWIFVCRRIYVYACFNVVLYAFCKVVREYMRFVFVCTSISTHIHRCVRACVWCSFSTFDYMLLDHHFKVRVLYYWSFLFTTSTTWRWVLVHVHMHYT